MFDFAGVVRGGEHDDGDLSQLRVCLDLAEDLNAIDFWHADVQEEQVGGFIGPAALSAAKKEVQDVLPVLEPFNGVVQPGPTEVFLDQADVTEIIISD
jgi:hypothetical protein